MENKINIAEILKDCPKGMELYSTIYGTVYFEGVRNTGNAVLIDVKTSCNTEVQFYPDGKFNTYYSDSEITLFPSKDVRNWEGFVPPCKFKDGDILFVKSAFNWIGIYKESENDEDLNKYVAILSHSESNFIVYDSKPICCKQDVSEIRYATEEEKAKLFQAIKKIGYKWNAETKTLDKLVEPKFKVGDTIQDEDGYKVKITEVNLEDECYGYESMIAKGIGGIPFKEQNNWELVPDKFDITTLVPFESRVLARDNNLQKWFPAMWGYYDFDSHGYPYKLIGGGAARYCIPYESNEHLLGTTNDCDKYYKNW